MPTQPFIVCVDCSANVSGDIWKPLSQEFTYEIVDNCEQALQLIAVRRADAVVATCPIAATNLVMQLKALGPHTPVLLLEVGGNACRSSHSVAIPSVSDIPSLVAALHERLSAPGEFPIVPRRYESGHLTWPFSVLADRSGEIVGLEGTTVTLGTGGMYGKMEGALQLGETVLVEFPNIPEAAPLRAQVRSRHHDIYGLAFETGSSLTRRVT
jgi:hypothetical protein